MVRFRAPEESFALLTPLVHYLCAKRTVTVQEAAHHFDVAPTRIRRAVQLLSLTGVPNEWGDPTMFDFDFHAFEHEDRIEISYLPALEHDTVKLSSREAAALVTGLERLRQIAADEDERISGLSQRIQAAAVDRQLTVATHVVHGDETLHIARRAIQDRKALEFCYRKPDAAVESRRIIPLRLDIREETTLVEGFDLERGAGRTFRVDRMSELAEIPRPEGTFLDDSPERVESVTLTVHATPAAAIALASYAADSTPAADGGRLLQIVVWELEPVLRAIMATGGEAQILQPQWAVREIRQLAIAAMR